MNLDSNPTHEQLQTIIRNGNDLNSHHVLWVKRDGTVELTPLSRDQVPPRFSYEQPDMQMRYETFLSGNEYVGPEAAEDQRWIAELFGSLRSEWAKAKGQPQIANIKLS